MCRFVVYKGPSILLSKLIATPEHSLIKQSYQATSWSGPLNGDGVGIGWYNQKITPAPALFKDVAPAWGNKNLLQLSSVIESNLAFAHVRAATGKTSISQDNCHPFSHGNYLWMHNGEVQNFNEVKRVLFSLVDDRFFNWVQGTTDSELVFYVLLSQVFKNNRPLDEKISIEEWKKQFKDLFHTLDKVTKDSGAVKPSHYNFVLSDGVNLFVTRYIGGVDRELTSEDRDMTLYYSYLDKQSVEHKADAIQSKDEHSGAPVMFASEQLTTDKDHWVEVPRNGLMIINEKNILEINQLS